MLNRPRFLEGSAAEQLEALRAAVREGVPSVMMTADPRSEAALADPEAAIAEALAADGAADDDAKPTRLVGPAAGGWVAGDGAIGLISAVGADFRELVADIGTTLRRGIDLGLAWDITPAEALAWLARDPTVYAIGLAGLPGDRHRDAAFATALVAVAARMPLMALAPASDEAAWAVFGVQTIERAPELGVALRDAAAVARAKPRPPPRPEPGPERGDATTLAGLERAQTLLAAALLMRQTHLGRHATLALLTALGGGRKAPAIMVASLGMARDAAARLGYPVVLGSDRAPLGGVHLATPEALEAAWDKLAADLTDLDGDARYEPRYVAAFPAEARAVHVLLGTNVVGPVVTWDGRTTPAVATVDSPPLTGALAALATHLPELTALELRAAETPAGLVLVDARARLASVLEVPEPGRYSPAV